MAKKSKDEFQELLDEELLDPQVATAFHEEKEALRLAIKINNQLGVKSAGNALEHLEGMAGI